MTNRHLYYKVLLCVLSVTLLAACQHSSSNRFVLEGKLSHLKSDTVFLLSTDPSYDRVDTLVASKGVLHFETELDTLVPFTLLCNDTVLLPFYGDRGLTVQLTFDGKKPSQWRVQGGEYNLELQEFRLWADTVSNFETLEAGIDTFLQKHPFSPTGVRLLNRYLVQQNNPNYRRLDELISQMSGLLHDDLLIAQIEEKVDRNVRADTGRFISSFQAKNIHERHITSYSFRDQLLVTSFDAGWDLNSKAVRDSLKKLQPRYKKDKVAFLFHSLETDKTRWLKEVEADTLYGEQTHDPEGWNASIIRLFSVEKLPTVIILNKQRKVVYRKNTMEGFTQALDSLIQDEKRRAKSK